MTQTSDDCASANSNGNSSTGKQTTNVGFVAHGQTEKENANSIPICVASTNTVSVPGESTQMEMVAKEQSTQTAPSKNNSDVCGIDLGADDKIENTSRISSATEATTDTDIPILTTNDTAAATSNGTVTEMETLVLETPSLTCSKAPMCAVCGEPCICFCKKCKRVSYCSKEHFNKHYWKEHRPECYPVTIQVNSVFGSHLIVTRDVKRGEVILREKPLLIGPFSSYPFSQNSTTVDSSKDDNNHGMGKGTATPNRSICLVCHNGMGEEISSQTPLNTCSKCGWPVCSPECEKHPTHADQECKIFAEHHVDPSALCDMDAQYFCVTLLRILLHKKHDDCDPSAIPSTASSSKWSKFMEVLNRQVPMKDGLNLQLADAKKATSHISGVIRKSLGSFIFNEFSVTDAEIDQIILTLRTSSFITDNGGYYINGYGESAAAVNNNSNLGHDFCKTINSTNISRSSNSGKNLTVYHLASMLTSNCIPNASWIIQQPSLDFYLRASTPIKTGEKITITFLDPLVGTQKRREFLWKEKYLSCSCTRCCDPTENSTLFSAIKCRGKIEEKEHAKVTVPSKSGSDGCGVIRECEGYVLPTDPLAVSYTSCYSSCCCCSTPVSGQVVRVQERDCQAHGENSLPGEKLCDERMAEWKCNVCLMRQPWGFVQNSLERMKRILNEQEDVCFTTNVDNGGCGGRANKVIEETKQHQDKTNGSLACSNLKILEARVDKIDSLAGNLVHANYYYILKMENEILSSISKLLERGQVPIEEMEKWAVIMIDLCKKGLKVVNVLCPGLTRERGHLLYFLQQGLTISLLFKTSRAMRIVISPPTTKLDSMSSSTSKSVNKNSNKEVLSQEELMKKFYEVILARKEILEIFALTKDNSTERQMLKAVQQDSTEVRLLKNYFKCHQNVSFHKT